MVKQQDLYQKMMVNNKQKSQPIPNDLSRTGWHKPILTFSKYPNVSAQRLLLILTWWQPIIIHIPSHGSANPKKMVEDQREVRTWEVSHTHINSIKTCNLGRMVIFNPSKSHGVIFKSCIVLPSLEAAAFLSQCSCNKSTKKKLRLSEEYEESGSF